MARLHFLNYGNEPGVLDMKISQAGSCNRKTVCYASPMLLRTGLGPNSSTGSLEQAPVGYTIYAYRCRVPFSTTGKRRDWTDAKVPYCYWPGPLGKGTPHEEGNTLLLRLQNASRAASWTVRPGLALATTPKSAAP